MWRTTILGVLVACGGGSTPRPVAETRHPVEATPPPGATASGPKLPPGEVVPRARGGGCDAVPDLSIDGLLDDWSSSRVFAHAGSAPDGAVNVHCAWDGSTIAFALDIADDRIVRVKGGREDKVTLALSSGSKPVTVVVLPGNQMAKAKYTRPARVEVADSLQPHGFSIEIAIPAAAVPDYSPSTPAFHLDLVFADSDAATGGDTTPLEIEEPIELGDRKDLVDDFLSTVRLRRTDIKLDTLVDVDPDRKGKERVVAGGTVIGVLTEQYAYVTLPAASPDDVRTIELLPLGAKGQHVIAAVVRQTGNGGSRDLLMLWTVWTGQLQPLVNIEIKKQLGSNILESTYKVAGGKLVVEPKPAVGFTPETWNEEPAGDADPIVLPWDPAKAGVAYALKGAEVVRKDLPKQGKRR
jgi:hypothetical protein